MGTTRVSSWKHPLEHIYRETYKTIVNFRNSNLGPAERQDKLFQLQTEVKQMEHDVQKDIAQWSEHNDEQGNRFYFNKEERQSTWTDPRPAKCQILYLKMKMLRLLQSGSGATAGFNDQKTGGKVADFATVAPPLISSSNDDDQPSANKRSKIGGDRGDHDMHDSLPQRSPDPMSDQGSETECDDERKSKKK